MKTIVQFAFAALFLTAAGWNAGRGLWLVAAILGLGGVAQLAGMAADAQEAHR